MAYYIDTDLGSDTTGDGSYGNPWQTFYKAVITENCLGLSKQVLYCGGNTEDTSMYDTLATNFQPAAMSTISRHPDYLSTNFNLKWGSSTLNIVFAPNYGFIGFGINFNYYPSANNNVLYHDYISASNNYFFNCNFKIFTTFTSCKLVSYISTGYDGFSIFENCIFDANETFTYLILGTKSIFNRCVFLNSKQNGSIDFNSSEGMNFYRCKFKNIGSPFAATPFIFDVGTFTNAIIVENCSFYFDGSFFLSTANPTLFFGTNLIKSFKNNIIESTTTINPAQVFYSINSSTDEYSTGSNIFLNCSTSVGNYYSSTSHPDVISTVTNYLSIDENSADFLKLATGADAENAGWYDSQDSGAYQRPATGTVTYANATDVRLGIDRGDGTLGTLDLPSINDVRSGVQFDNLTKTGNISIPSLGQVKTGVTFDTNDTSTGTYDGSDRWSVPSENDVREGTTFKENSLTLNRTGNVRLPIPSNVRDGIVYDSTHISKEQTGILDINTEANLPSPADVRELVTYGESNEFTGTLDPDADSNLPALSDVRLGTTFGEGLAKTGVLDLPLESNVAYGVTYDNNTKTGTLLAVCDYPLEAKVEDGVVYADGAKTGTLGAVDLTNLDIATQIKDNIENLLASNLTGYNAMRYVVDPSNNDFYNNTKQYGVLIKNDENTNLIIGRETIDLNVEIVLTDDFIDKDDDLSARDTANALIAKFELLRRKIIETRAGCYNSLKLHKTIKWSRQEPEFLDDDNIVILKANFNISYKI